MDTYIAVHELNTIHYMADYIQHYMHNYVLLFASYIIYYMPITSLHFNYMKLHLITCFHL